MLETLFGVPSFFFRLAIHGVLTRDTQVSSYCSRSQATSFYPAAAFASPPFLGLAHWQLRFGSGHHSLPSPHVQGIDRGKR